MTASLDELVVALFRQRGSHWLRVLDGIVKSNDYSRAAEKEKPSGMETIYADEQPEFVFRRTIYQCFSEAR